jgi:hypothetical protein
VTGIYAGVRLARLTDFLMCGAWAGPLCAAAAMGLSVERPPRSATTVTGWGEWDRIPRSAMLSMRLRHPRAATHSGPFGDPQKRHARANPPNPAM